MNSVKQAMARATEKFALRIFRSPWLQHIAKEALDATGTWHQRECPLKAPFVFSLVVGLGLFRYQSQSSLLEKFLKMVRRRDPSVSPQAVSPEALYKARGRLGVDALRVGFELTTDKVRPRPWFFGYRVYALDGTKAVLQDTAKNEAEFGRPGASRGKSAFPQALLLALVDVQTHRLRGASIHPCRMPERDASLELLPLLGKRDLLLLDRGYAAGWYLYELDQREIPFVVRCPKRWTFERICQLKDGSWLVAKNGRAPQSQALEDTWEGPRKFRNVLRMIEYTVGESPEIRILTNVLEPDHLPAPELAELYAQRWEGELVFDEIKNHLATVTHGSLRTLFRSKSPEGVRQEAYGLFLAYNLVREAMLQAARRRGIHPLDLSFVGSLECIREALLFIHAAPRSLRKELLDQLLSDIATQTISRPRRPVAYPRKKKRKMEGFGVKREHHKAEPRSRELRILTDPEPLCA